MYIEISIIHAAAVSKHIVYTQLMNSAELILTEYAYDVLLALIHNYKGVYIMDAKYLEDLNA